MHFPQGVSIFKSGLYSTIISLPDNKLSDLKTNKQKNLIGLLADTLNLSIHK